MDTAGPVKAPKQPRSQRTLERLARAGLDLLRSEGPASVTVQAVVARAGSSVGSFYARFDGKDDFLAYLRERIRTAEMARLREVEQSGAGEAATGLTGAIHDAVRLLQEAERRRAEQGGMQAGPAADAHRALRETLLAELEGRLLEHASQIAHASPQLAVRLSLRAALGLLATEPQGEGEPLDADLLVAEAVSLLRAYLAGPAGPTDPAQVDFFDAWG